jgi:hypothetical protein
VVEHSIAAPLTPATSFPAAAFAATATGGGLPR